MKTTKLLFTAFIIATILCSCKDNPVNPSDNLQPGKWDYVRIVNIIDMYIKSYKITNEHISSGYVSDVL